ncbi:hypothetical protein PHET_00588 [Paragonimus heterotremus]|uniref:protein-tyrosine-phosphatase n=1 Tax=Paragonimus heterotremus TaxID=100268 RepID=A0A8J4TPK7_9TREM|nr:hypothetical protein PHET_00588 [Paragonimus heterotremus]
MSTLYLPNELHDYINASPIYHITMPSKGPVKMNFGQVDYICTQAPLENTCGDFWRMIVENNVGIIVMLNKITNDVTPKCARYWPNRMHDRILYQSGSMNFQVKWTGRNSQPAYDERDFSVNRDGHGMRKHHVRQLAFVNWPDQGVPNTEEFNIMLNEYKELKAVSKTGSLTLVHCKTGIGRSGTFIAADILRRHLDEKCKVIDIPGVILQLRRCRPGMIRSSTDTQMINRSPLQLIQTAHSIELIANIAATNVL